MLLSVSSGSCAKSCTCLSQSKSVISLKFEGRTWSFAIHVVYRHAAQQAKGSVSVYLEMRIHRQRIPTVKFGR
jgi:hypothetical protein